MIKYTNEDKTLTVPSGLGNFAMNGGGGGDVTRQDVINIVDSAITEYDTEIQVDLEDIRENVSGNTDNIEALSATTENMAQSIGAINTNIEALSAATDNMASNVEALSAATGNIQSNVESISGQTSANTAAIADLLLDVDALDGRVSANTEAVQALSGVTGDVASLSAQTSANTAQIEALSATTEDIYNEIFYEDEGEAKSNIQDLWDAVGEKQDALTAGNGIDIDGDNIISVKTAKGLYFDNSGNLGVKTGNGLNFDGLNLQVKAGDGLGFSGDTLVVSGGSGNGPRVIFLNKLTEQERLALYNELASKYDYNTNSFTTAYTEDEYAFYIDLRDSGDQQTYQTYDHYEGFFPMQLERMHPSDYGGAAFFGGVEAAREGNGNLIQIRFVITFEGGYENGTWWNSPSSDPTMQFNLRINSDGTIANDQDWSSIADSNNASRAVMQYYAGTQYGDIYSEGKVKWVNMYPTTYNGETKWYWIWAADICIGTTMYSGVWGMLQDQWYTGSDVPPQVLQWTSGATYESQTYPSIV